MKIRKILDKRGEGYIDVCIIVIIVVACLAVYYEQNTTTEKFDDYDGERWILNE